ncbi:hypothetical protein AAVH_37883 [Aphelenchoides avenae]|nr:hypothetical protein AAVH_37883 [Aphelenchus avenae]
MKANFNSYKKRIETLIWGDEFECFADKLEQIAIVLSNWAPDGSSWQKTVYSIKIGTWGTIRDFVKCIDDGDFGSGNGGDLPGCGGEGSGSGSGSGDSGEGSGSGSGELPSCDDVLGLITIDESTNSTELTDAINAAFDTWDRNMKANFNSYKKRIETIIWGDEFPCITDKLEQIAIVLHNWVPDGSSYQSVVFSIKIGTWGTIGDFVKCVDDGDWGSGDNGELPGCGTGSGSTVSDFTEEGSGVTATIPGDNGLHCGQVLDIIVVDVETNSTDLTDAINDAFDSWTRIEKSNFNSYKKRIETLIWGDEFTCSADKLKEIAKVLENWASDGSEDQAMVYSIQIGTWGTIEDFVKCVNGGSNDADGSWSLPSCDVTTFVPEETTTIAGPAGPDCAQVASFITIDTATNTTILTSAINSTFSTWSRTDRGNFNPYKKRIETLIWGNEYTTTSDKLEQIVDVLEGYAPQDTYAYNQVTSIQIGTWGTIMDLMNCVHP